MSTQPHTSNRSSEVARKKKEPQNKKRKVTMAQLPPRLKLRPRRKPDKSKRRLRKRSELKKKRRDKDKLRRKSSNAL